MIIVLACFEAANVAKALCSLEQRIVLEDITLIEAWSCPRVKPLNSNNILVQSDNRLFDFSSWEDASRYILDQNFNDEEHVLFLNDSVFNRSYSKSEPHFIDLFFQNWDFTTVGKNYLYGYLDDFPYPVELAGQSYFDWIRTNIFSMNIGALKVLGDFVVDTGSQSIIQVRQGSYWGPGAGLMCDRLKAYLGSWLFGDVHPDFPEYTLSWHSACYPTKDNEDFFDKKIRTILCEHSLGLKAKEWGVSIIDAKDYERPDDRWTSPYYS